MNKWQEMYKQKLSSAEEIVKRIPDGALCATPCALGEAVGLADALYDRAKNENLTGITHHLLLTLKPIKCLQPGGEDNMRYVSWFTSGYARKPVQEKRADFMPCFYKDVPKYWSELVKPDVFYATVSSMDQHGWCSFGGSASTGRAQMSRAKYIFLEINENMPRTHGSQFIHISEVDAICENHVPMAELPEVPITEKDKTIGNYIAELIPNGATIQLGIGGTPNAVASELKSKKDLGIHSEMFAEVMVDLIEAGVVNNSRKNINRFKSVAGFSAGSKRVYDFLDDNPSVEFHSIDYVNDPYVIGTNDNFISINATIEVDLLGQACSESIGPKQFSGTGGQLDFVRGASISKGGKSILSTYSTTKKDSISKIKPMLTQGSHVTCTKNDIDYVATEYGIAKLKGKTASQRAKELIRIAHPKFREYLTHEAKKLYLIP
ncbi:MAG: 4-hydroxybutyrate--acetyl-CoA CoA transferase [Clostridia bacterium]|nr:4-hydroxybutyrate--acetyl-CoA CoA transferase [Clostridia bacterium]